MARDRAGFIQGMRRDEQGRPLKLVNQPTAISQERWDMAFGKKPARTRKARSMRASMSTASTKETLDG